MTDYQPQRRTVAFDYHAPVHERFAADVKLPEPGSPVKFEGHDTTLVSVERINEKALRITVEIPEAFANLEALIGTRVPFSFENRP